MAGIVSCNCAGELGQVIRMLDVDLDFIPDNLKVSMNSLKGLFRPVPKA